MPLRNELSGILGCRVKTHYGEGGVVTKVIGPFGDCYTLEYRHDIIKEPHWINAVRIKNGVITAYGVPLTVLGQEEPVQLTLDDYC